MATLLQVAQQIETDYNTEYVNVQICRPNMGAALGAGNMPYTYSIGADTEVALGVIQRVAYAIVRLGPTGPFDIIQLHLMGPSASDVRLMKSAQDALDAYKRQYHPFGTEFDSLWTATVNYFQATRRVVQLERVKINAPGTPVTGIVTGIRLVGNGAGTFDSFREQWYFEATYGTGWTFVSWRI